MAVKETGVHEYLVSVTNAGEGEIFEIIKGTVSKSNPVPCFNCRYPLYI